MIFDNKVLHTDCNIAMKEYPNKYFNLAIVDPPYYCGPQKKTFYGKTSQKNKKVNYPTIESWEIPDENYFNELIRISEHQIIFGCNYYKFQFGSGRIIWDKVNYSTSYSDCEIAYCSKINTVKLFSYMWNGYMQGNSILNGKIKLGDNSKREKRIHQMQKPVNLYKWLLYNFAKPGDKILDTHVGSGSSRIACYDYNFDFTGFEKDINVFNAQEKRFKRHISQLRMNFQNK